MRTRWTALAAAVVATAAIGWGVYQGRATANLSNALEAQYQRDFYNLINQVEQVQVMLGKSAVSGSAAHNAAQLTEVWFRANSAVEAIAHLPLKGINMSATRKFLTQVGDYAHTLALKSSRGSRLDEKEISQLERFEDETAKLARDLHALENRLAIIRFRWANAVRSPAATRGFATRTAQAGIAGNLKVFGDMNQRLQQMPSLIYDGPYSDHIEQIKPRGLTGERVTQDQAAAIARRFAGADFRVTGRSKVQGRIPAWSFILESRTKPGRVAVTVSQQGGHVLLMTNSRPVRGAAISPETATRRAEQFLRSHGYTNMVPTFRSVFNGTIIVSFVQRKGDVVIYPDQVKVKVAMDDGQVVGFDSVQYLVAHHNRNLPTPRLTETEAKARLNPQVKVQNTRLALIPLDGGKEVLAYEFRVTKRNDTYFVYINAENGYEENILKLINTSMGELTM